MDLLVVWLNLICVCFAAGFQLVASRQGSAIKRHLFGATFGLSLVYAGSYVWLLLDFPDRVQDWSQVMRGVSLVTWVVVWIVPALVHTHKDVAQLRRLEKLVEEAQARVGHS